MSAARSIIQSPPVRAMTARDPHSRRGGLRLGLLYHDPAQGITGEAWQHPGRRYRRAVSRMEGEA